VLEKEFHGLSLANSDVFYPELTNIVLVFGLAVLPKPEMTSNIDVSGHDWFCDPLCDYEYLNLTTFLRMIICMDVLIASMQAL